MTRDGSLRLLALPAAITDRWAVQLAEPQRRYHDLSHIEQLLAALPDDRASPELVAAIWLHDIVYDPRAGDNEERSAAQARVDLAGSGIDAERVAALILGTKRHDGEDAEQRLLNDLDLSILAAPAAAYDRYAGAIRAEYAHVPEPAYRTGRAAVLRGFLAQPAIFAAPLFTGREAQARANLRREIASLETAEAG